MSDNNIAVLYKDMLDGSISSEVIRLRELHFFFEDEANGEIQILEVDQTFDGWETMEVIYDASLCQ